MERSFIVHDYGGMWLGEVVVNFVGFQHINILSFDSPDGHICQAAVVSYICAVPVTGVVAESTDVVNSESSQTPVAK